MVYSTLIVRASPESKTIAVSTRSRAASRCFVTSATRAFKTSFCARMSLVSASNEAILRRSSPCSDNTLHAMRSASIGSRRARRSSASSTTRASSMFNTTTLKGTTTLRGDSSSAAMCRRTLATSSVIATALSLPIVSHRSLRATMLRLCRARSGRSCRAAGTGNRA